MKQAMTSPKQLPGESDADFSKRLRAWIFAEPRSKGDLKDFKSADFTFAPEESQKRKP